MTKDIHIPEEEIAQYAEALLKGNLSSISDEIKQHINECDDCANEVLVVSDMIKNIEQEPETKVIKLKKNKTWIGIAASLIILIGSAILIHITKETGSDINEYANVTDSLITNDSVKEEINLNLQDTFAADNSSSETKKKVKRPIPAEVKETKTEKLAFVSNEELDKLTKRFSESAFRGDEVTIVSGSVVNIQYGKEVKLEWKNDDKVSLIVEFFNNKGDKLFEEETTEQFIQTNKISEEGLYYWKLINDDFDLLFCGKIKIKVESKK